VHQGIYGVDNGGLDLDRLGCVQFDFEIWHVILYQISLEAESLTKCPLTLEITQFTPSLTGYSELVTS